MRILGLIPARGGSKGIPNKNRKKLNGKPLLHYTVEAALAAEKLERVIFSSEDPALIQLAETLGVEVPFVRPAYLSEDTSGSIEVVQHALTTLAETGEYYDAVCLLQVTTPFRSHSLIDEAISVFIEKQTDSLISVQKVPHQYNPHWVFEASEGTLTIATGEKEIIKQRQQLPESFIRDGAIYITKTDVLLKQHSFFGKTISYLETNPQMYVNIDTEADWKKAESIAKAL